MELKRQNPAISEEYLVTPQSEKDPMTDEKKDLPEPAKRALAEAEERRQKAEAQEMPKELGGRREGLEPVRYGDWERKGLAIDF